MTPNVSGLKLAAVVTVVKMVADVGLVATNPSKAVSDSITVAEALTITTKDAYVADDYVTNGLDYCSESVVVTA